MRIASLRPAMPAQALAPGQIAVGPVTDGTMLKRAPNDVGGLLDTSKGWTLHIPGPDESSGAAAKLIATQQDSGPPAAVASVATSAGPAVASR